MAKLFKIKSIGMVGVGGCYDHSYWNQPNPHITSVQWKTFAARIRFVSFALLPDDAMPHVVALRASILNIEETMEYMESRTPAGTCKYLDTERSLHRRLFLTKYSDKYQTYYLTEEQIHNVAVYLICSNSMDQGSAGNKRFAVDMMNNDYIKNAMSIIEL